MLTVVVRGIHAENFDEWVERVDGCVCVNGSYLRKCGAHEAVLVFPEGGALGASRVSADQAATFVRNFYAEGFEERVVIN